MRIRMRTVLQDHRLAVVLTDVLPVAGAEWYTIKQEVSVVVLMDDDQDVVLIAGVCRGGQCTEGVRTQVLLCRRQDQLYRRHTSRQLALIYFRIVRHQHLQKTLIG